MDSFNRNLLIIGIVILILMFGGCTMSMIAHSRYYDKCKAINGDVYNGKYIRVCVVDGKIVKLDGETSNEN